ncbi:MAG: serine/threonine-protein phosphatase [Anaerolineaceae bacterium]|nr:serine/threonine-protein phosphatase [Anaerolineaceae bacterium]MCB9098850.1 serine/threonine-protein phosphatase [Anaerolineales bacterium]
MNLLRRLFSQPKVKVAQATSQPPVANNGKLSEQKTIVSESLILLSQLPPGLHVGHFSHVGRQRKRNEDSLYALQTYLGHEYSQEAFGLFIVADGMGGHQKGELASALAAQTCAGTILNDIYLPELLGQQNSESRSLNEILMSAVATANSAVQRDVPEGGTTLTMTLVMGNNAYVAHIGDTRVYLFKDRALKQITKDHSLASRLKEIGQSTPEEIEQAQNVLYKAIGQSDLVESDVDTYVQHLPAGASLLMCTDGLWGMIQHDDIQHILMTTDSPQQACEQLVAKANDNGGRDNITAIVVSVGVEQQNS